MKGASRTGNICHNAGIFSFLRKIEITAFLTSEVGPLQGGGPRVNAPPENFEN